MITLAKMLLRANIQIQFTVHDMPDINSINLLNEVPASIYSEQQLNQVKNNISTRTEQAIENIKNSLETGVKQNINSLQTPVTPSNITNAPSIPNTDNVSQYLPDPKELLLAKLPFFAQGLVNLDMIKRFSEKVVEDAQTSANQIKQIQQQEESAKEQANLVYRRSTGR